MTNGEYYQIDETLKNKGGFSSELWAERFPKAWSAYLKNATTKNLRGFYDWCKEPVSASPDLP